MPSFVLQGNPWTACEYRSTEASSKHSCSYSSGRFRKQFFWRLDIFFSLLKHGPSDDSERYPTTLALDRMQCLLNYSVKLKGVIKRKCSFKVATASAKLNLSLKTRTHPTNDLTPSSFCSLHNTFRSSHFISALITAKETNFPIWAFIRLKEKCCSCFRAFQVSLE